MVPVAGTGGINRGPGTAPVTWGEATPELLDEMTSASLAPPRNVEEATQLLSTVSTAPNAAPLTEGVQAGAAAAGVTGEAVHQRRLHPRHRKAVAGFFDREDP